MTENEHGSKLCMGCHQPLKGGRKKLTMMLGISFGLVVSVIAIFLIFNLESGSRGARSNSDEILFINQWNTQSWMGVFVTENRIYLVDDRVVAYSHDFEVEDTFEVTSWLDDVHVRDDMIYYTNFGTLYRYDPETQTTQSIVEGVHNMVVIGDLIFHQSLSWGPSDLYVYDLERGERTVLVRESVREFMVNPGQDRLVFLNDEGRLYYTNMLGDEQTPISSQRTVWSFAYDGEYVFWEDFNNLFRFDFETEQTVVVGESSDIRQMAFIGDYLVFSNWDHEIHVMNRDGSDRRLLATDAWDFAVTPHWIIFVRERGRDDFERYVVDLEGNAYELTEAGLGDALVPRRDDQIGSSQMNQSTVPLESLTLDVIGNPIFMNQASRHTLFSDSAFLTEESVYFILRDSGWRDNVVRFDLDFAAYEVLMTDNRIDSIHIEGEMIYFISEGILYRYDIEASTRTTLAEDIFHSVHVEGYVYFRNERFDKEGLYALDLETGNIDQVIDDDIREFFVDVENDRIVFTSSGRLYQSDLRGRDRQRVTDSLVWSFTYDGEHAYWIAGMGGEFFSFHFESGKVESVELSIETGQMSMMGDYILVLTIDSNLYLIDSNDGSQRLLGADIWWFSVIGNLIVYEDGDFETRIMDLEGNSAVIGDFLLE